ncbi:mRNA-capping enzyme [Dirofilaria immitis]|nr:mRNA-capping enzyme [Dirofilaria immitis]
MASDEELSNTDFEKSEIEKARLGPPDRWLYCPSLGSIVAKHFLPFKTPLCKLYDDQIEKSGNFIHEMFSHINFGVPNQVPELGCGLISQKPIVEKRNCIYKKIPMKGHGEAPSIAETEQFCRIVRGFLQANPKDIVAVHCTHGFNRTGFLIAAYLASAMDWAIDAAIYSFAQMRPNGIYKQLYLDELMRRYGDEDDRIEAPPRPAWENGPIDGNRIAQDNPGSGQTILSNIDERIEEPKFMDGAVPSVKYVSDPIMRTILQNKPVSMERDNLRFLAEKKYMVSWKADGIRYMVLIDDEDSIYALDRNNNVKGESGNITDVPRLLIYDIIKFEGRNVGECDFTTRLSCIREDLIQPRHDALRSGRIRRENEPISIRNKDFWELEAVRKLFDEKFTKNVGHEIDGLIFQSVNEPYRCGRCDTLLKWKPPSHNSIDFQLRIRRISKPGELPEHIGFLFVQNQPEPMAQMKATKKLLPYDNKIIECTFKDGKWEFMRERTDKSLPNSSKTAKAVYNSIIHPVDKNSLVAFVEKICMQKTRKRLALQSTNDVTQKISRT